MNFIKEKKIRQHPIKILSYTTRSFWLLLIPLTRSLIAVKFDIASWLRGWWLDIVVIAIIFLYAFFRWYFVTFTIDNSRICASAGFFGLVKTTIPFEKICSVCCSQSPLYRPFKAYSVYIDTNSGSEVTSDLKLAMRAEQVNALKKLTKTEISKATFSYSPRKRNLLIFSLLFSSTLSGVILFSTLIIQSTRIIGREVEERFFHKLSEYAKYFTVKLPKYVVIVAMIVILGWLYSFVLNIMRHWNFTVIRTGKRLKIKSGIFTKRYHILWVDKINYIDVQQSLLMKLFKICSVHIHCSGYGKSRREIAALVPVTTLSEVLNTIGHLLPEISAPQIQLKPRLKNIMRFLWPPIWLCMGIPAAGVILYQIFPNWSEIIRFVAIITEIPSVWLLVVKIASAFTTGIGADSSYAIFSYCKLYKFHTVIVPRKKISKTTLYQTPMQYLARNCTLEFNTHGESSVCHRIKNFPLLKAQRFLARNKFYKN